MLSTSFVSFFQHPLLNFMQMLCHHRSAGAFVTRKMRCALRQVVLLMCLAWGWVALAQSTDGANPQDKIFQEVTQWVVQTQQLNASEFSFAPMDLRVQLQGCSLALVMDLPFSSRETVRVRCMGNPTWQLYLRVLFKPGAVALANSRPAATGPSGPSTQPIQSIQSTSSGSNPVSPKRQIVVGKQLLRAGSVLSVDLLHEQEHVGPGLDPLAVVSIRDVLNGEMVRDVPAGVPLRSHDVRRALLVKMGQSVILTISQGSGFSITARVEALQDGRIGDQVRLRNPDSGRILSGVVTGPNTVRGL